MLFDLQDENGIRRCAGAVGLTHGAPPRTPAGPLARLEEDARKDAGAAKNAVRVGRAGLVKSKVFYFNVLRFQQGGVE